MRALVLVLIVLGGCTCENKPRPPPKPLALIGDESALWDTAYNNCLRSKNSYCAYYADGYIKARRQRGGR